jgi:hypothetical protein
MAFSLISGRPCGIREHETDWLIPQNALVRASSPRSLIERWHETYSSLEGQNPLKELVFQSVPTSILRR